MFSQPVTGLTEDSGLPNLPYALDGRRMLGLFDQAACLRLEHVLGLSCTAEVLSHKLGQRCTIRYTLTRPGEGRPIHVATIIAKLYGKPELAKRLYGRTQDLCRGPFNGSGPVRIPAPLLLAPDLGLVLQEYVDGTPLRYALPPDYSASPISLAGTWLARLHAAMPLVGLKTRSLDQELTTAERWCAYMALHLGRDDAERLREALTSLQRAAGELSAYEPVMIHRDFYYGNVLWDHGQRLWVLDFDELSIGDPALDVGHFLAHLETLAYRMTGRIGAFDRAAAAFLRSYQDKASRDLQMRTPFYRAYTFLKLAATEVGRKLDGWERTTQVLTGLACRELSRCSTEEQPSGVIHYFADRGNE